MQIAFKNPAIQEKKNKPRKSMLIEQVDNLRDYAIYVAKRNVQFLEEVKAPTHIIERARFLFDGDLTLIQSIHTSINVERFFIEKGYV